MRRAWRKPPTSFHRWVAAHPWQWVLLFVGVYFVGLIPSAKTGDGFILLFGLLVAYGLAASLGGVLVRRKVQQYDSGAS